MAEISNSDSVALAIDLLKRNGFTVYPPGEVPHILVSINGGSVQLVSNRTIAALIIDSDISGMDSEAIVGRYDIRMPRIQYIENRISEFFRPTDTFGGLDPDNIAVYEWLKSAEF